MNGKKAAEPTNTGQNFDIKAPKSRQTICGHPSKMANFHGTKWNFLLQFSSNYRTGEKSSQ